MTDILILSGGSGSGKTSLADILLQRHPERFETVKTVTTREPRPGNDSYTFVDRHTFEAMDRQGLFLETNRYANGHFYGSPAREVHRIISEGHTAVLVVDVNGMREIVRKTRNIYGVLSIYIYAGPETVLKRLLNRGETVKGALDRLGASAGEIKCCVCYDACLCNESLDIQEAADRLEEIIATGKGMKLTDAQIERYVRKVQKLCS